MPELPLLKEVPKHYGAARSINVRADAYPFIFEELFPLIPNESSIPVPIKAYVTTLNHDFRGFFMFNMEFPEAPELANLREGKKPIDYYPKSPEEFRRIIDQNLLLDYIVESGKFRIRCTEGKSATPCGTQDVTITLSPIVNGRGMIRLNLPAACVECYPKLTELVDSFSYQEPARKLVV